MPLGTPPSDIFQNGQWYNRAGQPIGGLLTFGSSTPTGLAPSGTIGANGALTLGTALPKTYSPGLYLYFPAGAAFSGSPAGSYWCVMSSTTVGTVFNNLQGALPLAPSTLVPIVDAGPGAYVGAGAGLRTVGSITIPGGSMGPAGHIIVNNEFAWGSSATNKVCFLLFGGSTLLTNVRTVTGSHDSFTSRVRNTGTENRNSFYGVSEAATASSTIEQSFTIDTSQDQLLTIQLQAAAVTDVIVLQSFTAQVQYGG